MAINHGASVLPDAGRHAEAVEWATRLDRERPKYASTFGRMWIWSSIVCNLAAQKKDGEAAPWLEKIKALSSDNRRAHLQALICLDRTEEAERLMIARLSEPDPSLAVIAMQDWERTPPESPFTLRLRERWDRLRNRPAVREAFDKVGRRLSLPLARSYWGDF
jgi:hypothetical protein